MLEALERCLFHQFEQHTNSNILINSVKKDIKELLIFIDENSIESSSQNEDVRDLWMRYSHFREGVHHGQLGKTAQFWVKYMDKVWLLLRFPRATKTNNFMAHLQCLQELCPLFFAMDHQNYARYASAYLVSLINLPHSHPGADDLLKNWGFSVSRSQVPASRTAVDLSIEQTVNRQAKSKDLPPAEEHGWKVTLDGDLDYNCSPKSKLSPPSTDCFIIVAQQGLFSFVFDRRLVMVVQSQESESDF
ncbi:hypothetical protein RRG08_026164 [Elysia crispata]|uniref:Uncharacterized protein n=1 Tax=Elysia crispata TaxID=231223 RepID=A0AAE1DDS2_9GAST|nr:hypothetical protein RRG08_026164 [Elysia crispata]